ncbi:uncharacterized protein LOC112508454 isoform X3 [Cynara cardunculus var. scolymus]|uniref:uncharacterized protein LOC112508454 isoform X3 n=1 Tax=Cynara cardunculus var. scolymus TaxID=59895 RepID=UPI000D62FB3F|nr:uncharacterized protein LOC112508454 isoform X3 [Cynara cardunculus var. scolymus]
MREEVQIFLPCLRIQSIAWTGGLNSVVSRISRFTSLGKAGRQALISFAFWYRSSMEFCCAVPLLGRLLKRWPFRLISLIRSTFCRICIIVPSVFSSLLCSLSRGNNFLIT